MICKNVLKLVKVEHDTHPNRKQKAESSYNVCSADSPGISIERIWHCVKQFLGFELTTVIEKQIFNIR